MQPMRSLFVLAIWCVATLCTISPSHAAQPDEKALAARVEQLVGQVTRSKSGDIIAIDLENRAATDNDLKLLSAAPNLQKLVVWGVGITDAGLDHLIGLSSLVDLQLLKTRVTDVGLAKLVGLKKLKSLDLQRNAGITNAGMASVSKIPELTYLTLMYTLVGDPGLAPLA